MTTSIVGANRAEFRRALAEATSDRSLDQTEANALLRLASRNPPDHGYYRDEFLQVKNRGNEVAPGAHQTLGAYVLKYNQGLPSEKDQQARDGFTQALTSATRDENGTLITLSDLITPEETGLADLAARAIDTADDKAGQASYFLEEFQALWDRGYDVSMGMATNEVTNFLNYARQALGLPAVEPEEG